jgi:recombination associated protein RdgC
MLDEKVQAWEAQNGRAMKRAEKAQLAEELEFELLPKAFCVQKKMYALFDTMNKRLIINSASANQASQLTSLLRKSILGLSIEPLHYDLNLATQFAEWINVPSSLPSNLELASDCLLFSPDDEKKRFNCKGYELPADEILTLLSQGLEPAELSLVWNERVQFTLTQDLVIKRMKCLDYLVDEFSELRELEEEYQQKDAALTLLTGELSGLIGDLKTAFNKPKVVASNNAEATMVEPA